MSLGEKFLNKSNSYRHYKDNYDKLKKENDELKQQNDALKEIESLKKKMSKMEKKIKFQDEVLESQNDLFNLIFVQSNFKAGGLLRNIQLHSIELLKYVVNVIEKNDLTYWLDYGTLLGCIRHDGFLPWDDEIDISMPRKDYEKFVEAMKKELENSPEINEKIRFSMGVSKLRGAKNNGTPILSCQFIHDKPHANVDVHPLDYYDIDPNKNPDIIEEIRKDFIKSKRELTSKVLEGDYESYDEGALEVGEKFHIVYQKTDYIGSSMDGTGRRPVHVSKIYPLKKRSFEGIEVNIPNEPLTYLSAHYPGELMKLPMRVRAHNFTDYIVNNEYDGNYDLDGVYEETLAFWKSVNQND